MQFPTMDKLKEILAPLKEKFEVVLFGSLVEGGIRPRSDIDVAILSRKIEKKENIEIQKDILGEYPLKFDLRVFELLPIYIQISIIENYKVIFGNPNLIKFLYLITLNFKFTFHYKLQVEKRGIQFQGVKVFLD
jgi:predicted nucleotidyltransferase